MQQRAKRKLFYLKKMVKISHKLLLKARKKMLKHITGQSFQVDFKIFWITFNILLNIQTVKPYIWKINDF